jgi:hypothetical protein
MEFIFLSDYAGNWRAGQEVEVTEVPGHAAEFLVDSVALIPKSRLLQHGYFNENPPDAVNYFIFTHPYMKFQTGDIYPIVLDKDGRAGFAGLTIDTDLLYTLGHLQYGSTPKIEDTLCVKLHDLLQVCYKNEQSTYPFISGQVNDMVLNISVEKAVSFLNASVGDSRKFVEEKAEILPVQKRLVESYLKTELTRDEWIAMVHDWNAFTMDPAKYNSAMIIAMVEQWVSDYRKSETNAPKTINV